MATEILRPNSAGDYSQLTQVPDSGAHWDKVDEAISDEDTTYLWTNSWGYTYSIFNLSAHTGTGTINSVTVYRLCRGTYIYGTTGQSHSVIITSGVKYDAIAGGVYLPYTYTLYSYTWTTNPNTGVAWTWDDIDALQAGVILNTTHWSLFPYCTQVYVEIDYTPTPSDIVVTPPTLLLALTFYAPTVTALAPVVVTPPTLPLALTFYAPTVITVPNVVVTPPTLALALTFYAPTVTTGRLSPTLQAAQQETSYTPVVNFTFTHGVNSYTYGVDRLWRVGHRETSASHNAELILDNTDGELTNKDLKGYKVSPKWGMVTSAGEETSETAPLWVKDQQFLSMPGRLRCFLSCFGIPDRLSEDKASGNYTVPAGSTKTVKALITEVASGQAVTDIDIEEQSSYNSYFILNQTNNFGMVGQRIPRPNRTITGLGFILKKTGNPSGNVTFEVLRVSDGMVLGSTTFPCASITTDPTWCEANLTTAVYVNVPVYIWAKHINTDWLNYVQVGYVNTDAKVNENLVYVPWTGSLTEISSYDCAYRYKFQGAGISVFGHCVSWDVVYDSEDALISVYQPQDSLFIREGESRLDVIDKLLYYTGCERMFKADGKIHILVPTISGATYKYEYALESGHTFFSKQSQDGLVIPNKIVVKSREDDLNSYAGSATSAASYALIPISGVPIRTLLSSDAQAQAIASAYISRLEVAAQRGSASVPMNVGTELWDYVKVNALCAEDTFRIGNIGSLERIYAPNVYQLNFSFGGVPIKGVPGTELAQLRAELAIWGEKVEKPEYVTKELFLEWLKLEYAVLKKITSDLQAIGIRVGYFEAQK